MTPVRSVTVAFRPRKDTGQLKRNLALVSPTTNEPAALAPQMSAAEAQSAVSEINANISQADGLYTGTRKLLLDLQEREGWRALGYGSFRDCLAECCPRIEQAYAYRLADAARVDRNVSVSTRVETFLPEKHAYELRHVPDKRQGEVYTAAVKAAEGGEVTARVIREAVEQLGYGPNKWGARATESNLKDYARRFMNNSNEAQLAYVLILCLDSIPVRRLTAAADEVWAAITPEEKKALHARALSLLGAIAGEAS
jgi:hypothetical protein